jgi:hypothetical protein
VAHVRNKASVPDAAIGLLAQARNVSPEEFRRRLAAWDDALDADSGASGAKRRRAKRSLSFHNTDDGMGVTRLVLPNAEHALIFDAVQHMADELWRHSGDRESSPQQRAADAVVELIGLGMGVARIPTDGATPTERREAGDRGTMRPKPVEPTLVVFVDETDLRDGTGVGSTTNGSSLSIAEVRRLACAAGIIPVVMSGDGRVLDVGRTQRTCTDAQWWALALRDRGCVVKGCKANVWYCEAHHACEWEQGGPTNLANMGLLCHHHHVVLHHDNWNMTVRGGKCRIVDADGRTIETVDPRAPKGRRRRC